MTTTATAVDVELDGTFGIGGKVHGGYLLATAVGAAMSRTNPDLHPHPLAASAVYAAPPSPGAATVHVHEVKVGKTIATYRVALTQDGADRVEVFLTAGRLPEPSAEPLFAAAGYEAPHTAPLDQCIESPPPPDSKPVGARNFINVRLDPATTSWIDGDQARGDGDFRGWAKMVSNEWDPLLAQFILADCSPPATFDLGLFGWVPTLQLQVLLRRVPERGQWQQMRQHAVLIGGGLLDEDCSMWDTAGRLTVQARQLAAYRDAANPDTHLPPSP